LEQNCLDVRHILHKHSLKSIFTFNPRYDRVAHIRFNPENRNSALPYRNDVVLYIDNEPKESLLKPLSRILIRFALITIMVQMGDQMRKIRPNDVMKLGDRVYVPVSIAETRISKRYDAIQSGTLYLNADEINYLQRLVIYKDSAIIFMNKPPNLSVKVLMNDGKTERVMLAYHSSIKPPQEVVTEYRVLGLKINGCSWIEMRPLTYRKHQVFLEIL
ncbi:hypothetical protein RYX36_007852, partial [Vicia faba]